jgi:hypothetical protein
MTFHQDIHDVCPDPDHDACSAIHCYADTDVLDHETGDVIHPAGTLVWESHATNEVDPLARLNPDVPAYRHGQAVAWRPPTETETRLLGG